MPHLIKVAISNELRRADEAAGRQELARAWRHLERAHVLSQRYAWEHVVVHARMLLFAVTRGDHREVLGQLVRVTLAAPASWLGRAPIGNTGGADVGILTPLPLPDDLRTLLES